MTALIEKKKNLRNLIRYVERFLCFEIFFFEIIFILPLKMFSCLVYYNTNSVNWEK